MDLIRCGSCGQLNRVLPDTGTKAVRCGRCHRELSQARLPDIKVMLVGFTMAGKSTFLYAMWNCFSNGVGDGIYFTADRGTARDLDAGCIAIHNRKLPPQTTVGKAWRFTVQAAGLSGNRVDAFTLDDLHGDHSGTDLEQFFPPADETSTAENSPGAEDPPNPELRSALESYDIIMGVLDGEKILRIMNGNVDPNYSTELFKLFRLISLRGDKTVHLVLTKHDRLFERYKLDEITLRLRSLYPQFDSFCERQSGKHTTKRLIAVAALGTNGFAMVSRDGKVKLNGAVAWEYRSAIRPVVFTLPDVLLGELRKVRGAAPDFQPPGRVRRMLSKAWPKLAEVADRFKAELELPLPFFHVSVPLSAILIHLNRLVGGDDVRIPWYGPDSASGRSGLRLGESVEMSSCMVREPRRSATSPTPALSWSDPTTPGRCSGNRRFAFLIAPAAQAPPRLVVGRNGPYRRDRLPAAVRYAPEQIGVTAAGTAICGSLAVGGTELSGGTYKVVPVRKSDYGIDGDERAEDQINRELAALEGVAVRCGQGRPRSCTLEWPIRSGQGGSSPGRTATTGRARIIQDQGGSLVSHSPGTGDRIELSGERALVTPGDEHSPPPRPVQPPTRAPANRQHACAYRFTGGVPRRFGPPEECATPHKLAAGAAPAAIGGIGIASTARPWEGPESVQQPRHLVGTATSDTTIKTSWARSGPSRTTHKLRQRQAHYHPRLRHQYRLTRLAPRTKYRVWIQAFGNGTTSAPSAAVVITTGRTRCVVGAGGRARTGEVSTSPIRDQDAQ